MQPRLMRAAWSAPTGSFSILVRIDPHAADSPAYLAATCIPFQYPRADRPSCSSRRLLLYPPAVNLSVSSCGSTLMQPRLRFAVSARNNHSFSILVRIDPHAAHSYDCRRRNSSRLSVSSCGSTLMQHTAISGRRDAPRPFSILVRIDPHAAMIYQKRCSSSYIFQYPRADRPSCSPGLCYCHSPLLNLLSVSSCGSTLMQPKYWPRRTVWHALTFSILVRIDPHAACSASLV